MATNFDEIYCLNTVIKIDQRLVNKPLYLVYGLYWKYLQLAIPFFQYDCKKDLLDLVPFSLTEYSFIGDGVSKEFSLDPVPKNKENLKFYITTNVEGNDCSNEINSYNWDSNLNILTLEEAPLKGEHIDIKAYIVGHFNVDLEYNEKAILARAMNVPYYEEQMTNSKILNFATYGGSIKMHSQAEQLKVLTNAYITAKRELEGDISMYSYRTAPLGLNGLGARTVCLNQLRHKQNPIA